MKYCLLITFALLGSPAISSAQFCSGNKNIDIVNSGATDYDCGSFSGPVSFLWKVTGNSGFLFNDEYKVELKQDSKAIYSSAEFDDENEDGRSGLVGGSGGDYQVSIQCKNESFDCTYGRLQYKVVQCGCSNDDQVVLTPCNDDSFGEAADATCGGNCEDGYYSDPSTGCTECPNFKILATTNVRYQNLVGVEECGVQGTTGFWSLAAQGSVGADGTQVSWSLSRSQSVSEGVERSSEFSRAYGQVRGGSSSFETSVSVGFTTSASAGFFGTGVSVEASVDATTTTSTTKSWEVSTTATNAIGNAVSSVITNDQSITCEQSCGPNPDNAADVQGYIYNWVDAIYEQQTNEILHYVRTCATVCKYDNAPPICPPGKCFNRACTICKPDAFKLRALDDLASQVPPTSAPTAMPTEKLRVTQKSSATMAMSSGPFLVVVVVVFGTLVFS